MNYSSYRITLDNYATSSQVVLNAKQGDSGRKIYISLTDGSIPYEIEKGCRAVFTAEKPDGNLIYNDCVIEGNVIIYELTKQTTAAVGFAACEIKLYDANDTLLISPRFGLLIEEPVFNDQDISGSGHEFNAVADIITYTTIKYLEEHPVATDDTLSTLGMAADAKATGEAISAAAAAASQANYAAQSAHSAASEAQSAANVSQQSANNAQSSANSAQTAANNAQTTADNAKTAADNAKTAADNAKTAAINADAKAASKCSKIPITVILAASGWTDLAQTVTAEGVTPDNDVIIAPDPASFTAYTEAGVRCTAQADNQLTFQCSEAPTAEIAVNVLILN